MTEKNAGRLRQFEDPEDLQRLLLLPEQVFAELRHRGDRSRAACVQARSALAVAILLAAPIRLGNLVALRLGVHLLSSRRGTSAWHLVIPADETKNTRALEFALPAYVVALLRQYLERYRPLAAPPGSDYLFASPSGGHLATDNLGPRISRFVRQRTGLAVNPHLFRHLAAKLVLEDTPGGYGIAQDILGHKNPMTTRNFYAGTETAASLRLFEQIVLRKRATLS
jgi:integrase